MLYGIAGMILLNIQERHPNRCGPGMGNPVSGKRRVYKKGFRIDRWAKIVGTRVWHSKCCLTPSKFESIIPLIRERWSQARDMNVILHFFCNFIQQYWVDVCTGYYSGRCT